MYLALFLYHYFNLYTCVYKNGFTISKFWLVIVLKINKKVSRIKILVRAMYCILVYKGSVSLNIVNKQ